MVANYMSDDAPATGLAQLLIAFRTRAEYGARPWRIATMNTFSRISIFGALIVGACATAACSSDDTPPANVGAGGSGGAAAGGAAGMGGSSGAGMGGSSGAGMGGSSGAGMGGTAPDSGTTDAPLTDAPSSPDAADATDSGATDAPVGDVTSSPDGGDAGACNTLNLTGAPVVNEQYGSGAVPTTAQGGTIVPGLYKLTSVVQYGADAAAGPNGHTRQERAEMSAGTSQVVLSLDGKAPGTFTTTWAFVGDSGTPTQYTQAMICPTARPVAAVGYTATGTGAGATLVVYVSGNPSSNWTTEVVTFTHE
jgi:hypothetical protein